MACPAAPSGSGAQHRKFERMLTAGRWQDSGSQLHPPVLIGKFVSLFLFSVKQGSISLPECRG